MTLGLPRRIRQACYVSFRFYRCGGGGIILASRAWRMNIRRLAFRPRFCCMRGHAKPVSRSCLFCSVFRPWLSVGHIPWSLLLPPALLCLHLSCCVGVDWTSAGLCGPGFMCGCRTWTAPKLCLLLPSLPIHAASSRRGGLGGAWAATTTFPSSSNSPSCHGTSSSPLSGRLCLSFNNGADWSALWFM